MVFPIVAVLGKVGAAIGKGAAAVGKTVGQAASTAGKAVAQGASTAGKAVAEGAKTAGQTVAKGVGETAGKVAQSGSSAFQQALQQGGQVAGQTASKSTSPFVNALTKGKEFYTKAQSAYNNLPEWQRNLMSNSLNSLGGGDSSYYYSPQLLDEDYTWAYQPTQQRGYYGY